MPALSIAAALRNARVREPRAIAAAVTVSLTSLALLGGTLLFALDLWPGFLTSRAHRFLSATPLLAIAVGYLVLQLRIRPRAHELLKRALLSLAFISWSASQLAPASGGAPVAGDLAIGLFVLDLGLIIWDELHTETTQEGGFSPPDQNTNGQLELRTCPCCGGLDRAGGRVD